MFASLIAAFVARLVVHPLDTLKTRLQYKKSQLSTASYLFTLIYTEGFFPLYYGITVTIALSCPGLAVYLTIYDCTSSALHQLNDLQQSSILVSGISAVVAEMISGLIWTPMVFNYANCTGNCEISTASHEYHFN